MQPTRHSEPAPSDGVSFSFAGESISADTLAERPRRKRKRRLVLGFGPRIVIVAAVGAVAAVILCAFVNKAVQPYRMQREQASHIRQLKSQLSATQSENGDLLVRIAALKRADGVETEARAQGFLKPGEVSLDITAQQPPAAPPPAQSTGLGGWFSSVVHRLTGR